MRLLLAATFTLVACGGAPDEPPPAADDDPSFGNDRPYSAPLPSSPRIPETAGAFATGATSEPPLPTGQCNAAASDLALVSSFIDTLPYAPANDAARAEVVHAIVTTCSMFAPKELTKRQCFAHLAAAIHKESAYDRKASVTDAYAKRWIASAGASASDPTLGLLQIRFSSTVHDYAAHGPPAAMACTGCAFPSSLAAHLGETGDSRFWAIDGPAANTAMMETPACNVALGAWYYYVNATGNGDPKSATYIDGYCAGGGTAADIVTGLRSHLDGPSGGRGIVDLPTLASSDPGAYAYVSAIKGWFDGMLGPSTGTHPFFLTLAPAPRQYCR